MELYMYILLIYSGYGYLKTKVEQLKLLYYIIILIIIFLLIYNKGYSLLGYLIIIVYLSALIILFTMIIMSKSSYEKYILHTLPLGGLWLGLIILYILIKGNCTLTNELTLNDLNITKKLGNLLCLDINNQILLLLLALLLFIALIGILTLL